MKEIEKRVKLQPAELCDYSVGSSKPVIIAHKSSHVIHREIWKNAITATLS